VLAEFIDKAMEQAVYDIIEDEGTYWGEIPKVCGRGTARWRVAGVNSERRSATGSRCVCA